MTHPDPTRSGGGAEERSTGPFGPFSANGEEQRSRGRNEDMNTGHRCTAQQAAHRLGLPVATVKRLVGSGVLASGRIGRTRTLDVADVERYANRRRGVGIR